MHATIFRAHQKKLKKQIRTEKRKKKSDLLCQRKRYSIEANTSLLHYSTNIGLRNFPFSTGSSAYKQKNDFLKKMYIACKAHLSTTDVYAYMLKKKDDIITKFSSEELEQLAQYASKHSEHWKKCTYNQNCNWTYISATHNNNSSYLASNHLKIYVALDILNVEPIFIETIEQLLKKASFSFAAKVSHVSRADQICYWIHPDDYTILDDFFSAYREHLRTDIPFMFYQNGIGISKDFREEISHNTMQAELITEYFKLVSSEDEVQLSSMYQIFIDSWNHSSSHSAYFIRRFSRTPVLCFLVLMDTLGMLLEEQSPCQISLYFCTDMHFWKSLEESHCWADLNQKMK